MASRTRPALGPARVPAVAGLVLLLTLESATTAMADIAPPDNPPGTNLVPGSETTQVRMMGETVVLDVQSKSSRGAEGETQVTADFQMRNLGSVEEQLDVRFPLSFWDGASDGQGNYPEIREVTVRVDGATVPTRRVVAPAIGFFSDTEIPWLVFPVTFPPGEDVAIRVRYTGDGTGEGSFVAFKYILETGAGWNGTIGTADLIVRLPYDATAENVIFEEHTGYSQTTAGGVIQDGEVRWHYEDLEPTYEQNLEISLVKPEVWQQMLRERQRVEQNPNDGEAWGRLGKLYKEMVLFRRSFRQDPGGQALYQRAVEAYDRSVTLLPRDALWHYGFADLLFWHYYWHVYLERSQDPSEIVRAAEQIRLAYALKPDDQRILYLIDDMADYVPGTILETSAGYDFPILTATPAPGSAFFPTPFYTPTYPPMATATPDPTAAPPKAQPVGGTSTPTSAPKAASPASAGGLCGSSGIAPAILLVVPTLRALRKPRRRQDA